MLVYIDLKYTPRLYQKGDQHGGLLHRSYIPITAPIVAATTTTPTTAPIIIPTVLAPDE